MPLRRGIMASGVAGVAPDPPTGLSASSGANGQSVLTWTAPVNNGGGTITDYIVQVSTNNLTWTTFSDAVSATTGATVTGLSNGTLYYFQVASINTYGTSTYVSTSATPYTVPSAPAKPTLSAGTTTNTTDTFTWIAPANNGSAISTYGYQVSADNGASWGTEVVSNVLTYAFNTLVAPTTRYSVQVRAYNSAGWGAYSVISDQSAAWAPNAGTETQGPQTKATASESVSQTDTDCSHSGANCSTTDQAWCDCGLKFRSGTRTASRTRTRTRTNSASRYRSRSTNYYSRSGNSNTSTQATGSFNISDAEWNLDTSGTTGYTANPPGAWTIADAEWNLGTASGTVGWGAWSNGSWSYGAYGACDESYGTWNMVDPFGGNQNNFLGDGVNWDSGYSYLGCYGFVPSNNVTCDGGAGVNIWYLYVCQETGGRKAVNQNNCCYPSCC